MSPSTSPMTFPFDLGIQCRHCRQKWDVSALAIPHRLTCKRESQVKQQSPARALLVELVMREDESGG